MGTSISKNFKLMALSAVSIMALSTGSARAGTLDNVINHATTQVVNQATNAATNAGNQLVNQAQTGLTNAANGAVNSAVTAFISTGKTQLNSLGQQVSIASVFPAGATTAQISSAASSLLGAGVSQAQISALTKLDPKSLVALASDPKAAAGLLSKVATSSLSSLIPNLKLTDSISSLTKAATTFANPAQLTDFLTKGHQLGGVGLTDSYFASLKQENVTRFEQDEAYDDYSGTDYDTDAMADDNDDDVVTADGDEYDGDYTDDSGDYADDGDDYDDGDGDYADDGDDYDDGDGDYADDGDDYDDDGGDYADNDDGDDGDYDDGDDDTDGDIAWGDDDDGGSSGSSGGGSGSGGGSKWKIM